MSVRKNRSNHSTSAKVNESEEEIREEMCDRNGIKKISSEMDVKWDTEMGKAVGKMIEKCLGKPTKSEFEASKKAREELKAAEEEFDRLMQIA